MSDMEKTLREALIIKYEGEIAEAKANVQVYLANPVGIGEHPDIIAAMDIQIEVVWAGCFCQQKSNVLLSSLLNIFNIAIMFRPD